MKNLKNFNLILICLIFLAANFILNSQPQIKHYDNWIFGEKAAITFNTIDGNPEAFSFGDYRYNEGTISYSDNNGKLLYYLELFYYNAKLKKNGGSYHNDHLLNTNNSISNTGLFIQDISDPNLIHLFTVDGNQLINKDTINRGVNYLLINKSKDKIIENRNLFINSVEKIAAVYNEIDKVVWIVTHQLGNNTFNIYKIDENGFDNNVKKQDIGFEHKSISTAIETGRMNFSPNGTTLAVTIPFYDPDNDGFARPEVQLFNFDPKTGILSNPRELKINKNTYSTCFSPNGKILYVKVDNAIYQYDLTICNWNEMIDKKYIINTKNSPFYNAIERGSNGIIYCGREKNTFLDAILNPDIVGAGCNYKEDVVSLGWSGVYMWGLPTVINSYFTGDYDNPCTQEEPKPEYTISQPSLVCYGDEFEVNISSDKDVEFTAEIVKVYPNSTDEFVELIDSKEYSLTFKSTKTKEKYNNHLEIFEARIKTKSNLYDTLIFSLRYWFCCGNTIKNWNFGAVAANGNCFTDDYETDMDFRASKNSSCPKLFSKLGQLASSGNAVWHNYNFDKKPKVSTNFLIGDPLPNTPLRAWYQNNPTRKDTRYRFRAYVCNVEKISRLNNDKRKLNFWLGVRNRNQDIVLKRIDDVKYDADWIELSDEFIAEDNTTELAIWVMGESPSNNEPSYGFGIDEVTLIPLPDYNLETIKDTIICETKSVKLESKFEGEISSLEWTPTIGLDDPRLLNPIASPTESTTYSLKITDKYYCEFQENIVVDIDPCLPLCTPDLSVYLNDKVVQLGDTFCINGTFIPECEDSTFLYNLLIYFEYDPRLMSFLSATSSTYSIIPEGDKYLLILTFKNEDFILNQINEFSFCFRSLLGHSANPDISVYSDESTKDSFNLIDYINSNIEYLSCDQPFRQIDLITMTDFEAILVNRNLSIKLATEEEGLFKFIIVDVNGQIVKQKDYNTSKSKYSYEEIFQIDLSDISSGVYNIRMTSPSGKYYTKKIMIL